MKYHTEVSDIEKEMLAPIGKLYYCNHPIYDMCTLYKLSDGRGIAVIQQYRCYEKLTYWSNLECWLSNKIARNVSLRSFLEKNAKLPKNGLYPTYTVRQLMWALRMKPLKKEPWETVFDHKIDQNYI